MGKAESGGCSVTAVIRGRLDGGLQAKQPEGRGMEADIPGKYLMLSLMRSKFVGGGIIRLSNRS